MQLSVIGYKAIGSPKKLEEGGRGDDSVAAGDGVALISQILLQVLFHLHCRLIGHGVEMLVKLRQQSVIVPFHDPGRFVAVLVVQKSLING